MDGIGRLFVAENGSVYALLPATEREPPPRRSLPEDDAATQALLAQLLQRQQQQAQHNRQQLAPRQLESIDLAAQQRDDVLHELLQASILQSLQNQVNHNTTFGPSTSSHLGPSGQQLVSRRRAPSVESPSNSDSQSPTLSARGGDRSERSNGLGVSTQLSAKEKNRQAQRRFRERQKDLIANLKQRVEELQTKVNEGEREIIALKEENARLRGRVEAKQQQQLPSVTLPAEALHSLLQMTGAGHLLAEVTQQQQGGGAGRNTVVGGGGGRAPAGMDQGSSRPRSSRGVPGGGGAVGVDGELRLRHQDYGRGAGARPQREEADDVDRD